MNERFKEIERQCWQSTDSNPYAFFDVKKFAQLIVRESMTIAQEYDGTKLGGPGLIIAMRIEQHFGVEE